VSNFSFKINLFINLIGRSWASILSIFFLPITVKLMGIEAYGLVGFFVSMINIVNIFEMGIVATLSKELSRISSSKNSNENLGDLSHTFEITILSITIIISIMVYFFSSYIAGNWIKTEDISKITLQKNIILMGIAVASQFPQSFYFSGLMALQKQIQANVFLIFYGTLRVVGSVGVLYFFSSSPETFFLWQILINVIGCIILHYLFWNFLPQSIIKPRFNTLYFYKNWKFSIVLFGNSIVGIILTQIDKLLLSKTLTLKMFSYYSIAITISSCIALISGPISSFVFSQYIRLKETNSIQELNKLFHITTQTLALLLFPVCSVLVFYCKDLIFIWMKNPVIAEKTYIIATLFIIGGMINAIASIPFNCAIAFGWPKLIFWSNSTQILLMVPLLYFLIREYQGVGAGISWVILNSLYLIFTIPIFFRRYFQSEIKIWYIQDIGFPLLISMSVAFLTRLAFPQFSTGHTSLILWILGSWIITFLVTALFLPYIKSEILKSLQKSNNHVK
jgi:O-antigen/teichoic acid export membrane protein